MNFENIQSQEAAIASNQNQQYLTFILEGEEYGVDILKVHEIKGWSPTTPIPNTPNYMKGVINLRGTIVPVIDLRQRFGLEALVYGPTTVVIVLNVTSERGEQVMGMVVDAVSDTHTISRELLKPAPDMGGVISTDFITGLATVEEKMVILLDIDHLLSAEEMTALSVASERRA
ncbi:chemotaxis protein CheW [Motiliproteus sp. MSK22-1]|uniref:chemotaxis protein CheW n=1 Tax=Motiliproteus sp. MSK22-1 TaxID=1897630 RepID=UPI00097577EB|nr:chemotaxis protein CheW [Motiliproteus sp. MSK22-1]OMH32140.1 chemotaxis protein CheW [Motiliproteus sp. MSK22-1]